MTSAFRCGAKRVTCVFRRAFKHIRAVPEEMDVARCVHTLFLFLILSRPLLTLNSFEKCDFLPYASPKAVTTTGEGADKRITHMEFCRYEVRSQCLRTRMTCELLL